MGKKYDLVKEAERISELCAPGDYTPERAQAYSEYCRLLSRAINEGQVGRSDRILRLYPIIREINDEIDEIEEEEARMKPAYEAADKVVDAFADLVDSRDAMPARVHKKICDLLVEWVGDVDFRLSGELLKEHSLRPTLGDAVVEEVVKRSEASRPEVA